MSYILEPVDSVEVLILMDNSTDMTLESNEIAARTMFGAGPEEKYSRSSTPFSRSNRLLFPMQVGRVQDTEANT